MVKTSSHPSTRETAPATSSCQYEGKKAGTTRLTWSRNRPAFTSIPSLSAARQSNMKDERKTTLHRRRQQNTITSVIGPTSYLYSRETDPRIPQPFSRGNFLLRGKRLTASRIKFVTSSEVQESTGELSGLNESLSFMSTTKPSRTSRYKRLMQTRVSRFDRNDLPGIPTTCSVEENSHYYSLSSSRNRGQGSRSPSRCWHPTRPNTGLQSTITHNQPVARELKKKADEELISSP